MPNRKGVKTVKRRKEMKINVKVGAWRDLQAIINAYRKKEEANQVLINDLLEIAKAYEKSVFEDLVEE